MARSHFVLVLASVLLTTSLGACGGPEPGPAEVTFKGIVIDITEPSQPVTDAWAVVDVHGGEVVSVPVSSTGEFDFAVPEGSTLTVTAGAPDRTAITVVGVDSSRTERLPLRLVSHDPWRYRTDTWSVTVTVDNLPAGPNYLLVYGHDQRGTSYAPIVGIPRTATLSFDTQVLPGVDELGFTLAAIDGASAEFFDVLPLRVLRSDTKDYQLSMPGNPPTLLTQTTNRPVIDGTPLEAPDQSKLYQTGAVIAGGSQLFQGGYAAFATSVSDLSDGFSIEVPYFAVPDATLYASTFLGREVGNLAAGYSMVHQVLEPGAIEVAVALLDTPVVDASLTWEPGATVDWTAIAGAERYALMTTSDDLMRWWITTEEPTLTFPRFPADFDLSRLTPGGGWHLMAQSTGVDLYTTLPPGEVPPLQRQARVAGGLVSF